MNDAGKGLVKVLRNEEEVFIPGIVSEIGPYYIWEVFKDSLLEKVN